ncbi:MAG TPA: type II toxin-antitoxin system prevent-host-death family antitoxin [Caulobacterales bacterium]|jgi:prevent-host-death family protein|nr:type II toxin-antitoxin system prevent-host-death family antitoxin [Caulobacterales bacterium]
MPDKPTPVTIHAAKTNLSQLIARVEAGEEVIIARGDKPVAKLTAVGKPKPKRVFGSMSHLVGELGPEFFEPLPAEELAAWEGALTDEYGISLPEKK